VQTQQVFINGLIFKHKSSLKEDISMQKLLKKILLGGKLSCYFVIIFLLAGCIPTTTATNIQQPQASAATTTATNLQQPQASAVSTNATNSQQQTQTSGATSKSQLVVTPIPATVKQKSSLRYDGFYVSIQQSGNHYLRFYEDGTVISVTVAGTPNDLISGEPQKVAKWFKKEDSSNFSKGQYKISDSELEFTSTSKNGSVDYNGTIAGEKLSLHTFSHINGNESNVYFNFIEIIGIQP
jgi:hypothetical protein